jgi:putative hydrolase of HD superfamily
MISEFFFQIAELKKLPRSGWKIKVGLEKSESVAEHSYMMSVMAMVFSDLKNLNSEKVIKMSILHDWAESKIGDFMPDQIEHDKKSELENYAMIDILESLPHTIQNDYQNIWNEFLNNDTPESRLVHELDKLEMALQAKIYEKDVDSEKVKPFIISAVEQIMDPDVKKTLMDILK